MIPINEKTWNAEAMVGAFVDNCLTDQEVDQLVRFLVFNKDLRQEMREQLTLHELLCELARRGWES